jgi:hypothetical protein
MPNVNLYSVYLKLNMLLIWENGSNFFAAVSIEAVRTRIASNRRMMDLKGFVGGTEEIH